MLLVVTSIATLVQIYSIGYMKEDPGFASLFCLPEFVCGIHAGPGAFQ
jgi:NADH-quinone oxidoreductase subunit L